MSLRVLHLSHKDLPRNERDLTHMPRGSIFIETKSTSLLLCIWELVVALDHVLSPRPSRRKVRGDAVGEALTKLLLLSTGALTMQRRLRQLARLAPGNVLLAEAPCSCNPRGQ